MMRSWSGQGGTGMPDASASRQAYISPGGRASALNCGPRCALQVPPGSDGLAAVQVLRGGQRPEVTQPPYR